MMMMTCLILGSALALIAACVIGPPVPYKHDGMESDHSEPGE